MYELRDASWFDRGTGHCKGIYDDSQDLALIVVEAEDSPGEKASDDDGGVADGPGGFLKEDLLLTSRVEKEDIYARQQGSRALTSESEAHCSRYTYRLDRAWHSARHRTFVSGC